MLPVFSLAYTSACVIQEFLGGHVPLDPGTLETLIRCTCSSAEFCHPVIKLPKSLPILESFFLETTIDAFFSVKLLCT